MMVVSAAKIAQAVGALGADIGAPKLERGHLIKVVEILGWPTEVIAQAACAAMLRSRSLSAASMREKASTCM